MARRTVRAALVAAALACGCSSASDSSPATGPVSGEPAGTQTFDGLAQNHVDTPVEYPQSPPVGGPHSPTWQNCGFYPVPVPNERAVHSLEHGAVWIAFSPELADADVATLESLGGGHVLISPYEGLGSPIVATAWGKQLAITGVDDPNLAAFINTFEEGPQTPEPGAPCTGGTSSTD